MKQPWLKACHYFALIDADFYTGCRKIITGKMLIFNGNEVKDDLTIQDCGFTKSKLTMLRRLYLHQESHAAAQALWERRVGQGKYGSVGFTCYNHFVKSDPTKKSKRASVMGPCIQSVTLTLMNDRSTVVDAFYRTTELLKKFPADLVFLRDELLPPFKITNLNKIRFHFANMTVHPMYWVTVIPSLSDPIGAFEEIKDHDRRFYDWAVKWTARYICDEYGHGIQKFAQAMRVKMDAMKRISGQRLARLQAYLRKNHPGYRSTRFEHEEENDGD